MPISNYPPTPIIFEAKKDSILTKEAFKEMIEFE